jgi:hypothetical protein
MKKDYLRMYFEKADDGAGEPAVEKEPKTKEPDTTQETKEPDVAKDEKTFTQEEVNAINIKTKNKFYKDLGFKDEEAYKEDLATKQANMGAVEKLAAAELANSETLTRAEVAEAKVAVLELGVPKNKADRVIKLAKTYDGENMADKVAAVLKEYPEFKAAGVPAFGNGTGGENQESREEKLKKVFKANLTG